MRNKINILLIIASLFIGVTSSCNKAECRLENFSEPAYQPAFALGFEILTQPDDSLNSLIVTRTPWQGGDGQETSLLILRDGSEAPEGFGGQVLRGVPQRIVCMSSSHIAMLDVLGATDRIVGVSGKDFITNEALRSRFDEIGDVGYENDIDYEMLLSLRPDIVTFYGLSGANPMEGKLRELAIPFVYIGEYLEESPLGKAEWILAMGEIIGRREKAAEWFAPLPHRYAALKDLAATTPSRPKVMLNTPYGDSWVMPSSSSYMARLIEDAGADYIYKENTSSASTPIDIEKAYFLVSSADFWVNVGRYYSLADLRSAFPKFAETAVVKNGNVWNNGRRLNSTGGNDFWESGALYPDLVLRDFIKIFHPELCADSTFEYYEKL